MTRIGTGRNHWTASIIGPLITVKCLKLSVRILAFYLEYYSEVLCRKDTEVKAGCVINPDVFFIAFSVYSQHTHPGPLITYQEGGAGGYASVNLKTSLRLIYVQNSVSICRISGKFSKLIPKHLNNRACGKTTLVDWI